MSIEALVWALNEAPVDDPVRLLVLVGLANHADADGRNAFPSDTTLAEYARCSTRTVLRHRQTMEAQGVIRRGDQSLVERYRADRRPVVWDIPGVPARGDRVSPRGNSGVTANGERGDKRGDRGVVQTVNEQTPEPSNEPSGETAEVEAPQLALVDAGSSPSVDIPVERSGRACRLPESFTVTEDMLAWAHETFTDASDTWVHDQTTRFCDYWRAIGGERGRKLDWPATWRNWLRRDYERVGNGAHRHRVSYGHGDVGTGPVAVDEWAR